MLIVGGLYKVKGEENRWILINKKLNNGKYVIHDILIDEDGYDVDISEVSSDIITALIDTEKVYNGIWKNRMLYAVWDGANKSSKIIVNPYI